METKRKIEVGKVYSGKVGGTMLPIKIEKSLGHGRYEAATMPGGNKIKISSDAIKGDGESVEQWQTKRTPKEHDLPAPIPATKGERPKTAARSSQKKDRKPSGLDAAVAVLAEAGTPMNCGDMVKRMLETGLWKTNGKTPSATIYAAIITEIAKKGDKSRFRKTDRGHFELTTAGKAGN